MNDKLGRAHKQLKREIVITADGSSSLIIPEMDEMYHSKKGAIQESQFVYIDHGLCLVKANKIDLLEVGMGTGLNVALSLKHATAHNLFIDYNALEPYPLNEKEWASLNYDDTLQLPLGTMDSIHNVEAQGGKLSSHAKLQIFCQKLEDWEPTKQYDVIYFDAFAPNKQSGPWVIQNIEKLYNCLKPGGVLTTYCAQGQFKRNLKAVGFTVINPAGPMGKREITVAYK